MGKKYDGSLIFDTKVDSNGFEKGVNGLKKLANIGGAAIATGLGAAVKVGMDFESQMSKVGSISMASAEDMEILTAKAKEMGEKTVFSASQAGEAFEYMAMAGWKTEEMTSGISGIMDLAAASGENLGTVSDIVTDALTAFGLQASDSSRFADVLAAASSNANTNVSMMGETFKYVAPVAGALGYSIEDTSLAIGLMANSGIKGSQAGTALRSVLSRLSKPTKQTDQAMADLGLSLTDSSGNMKTLRQVMGDMRKSMKNLTKDQQAAYAAMLGGQEAMSGLLAIVNSSEGDFDKLSEAIDNSSGTAQEMADRNLDNLKGQLTLAGSAAEALGIAVYESIEEPLKNVAKKGTEYLQSLAEKFGDPIFVQNIMGTAKLIGVLMAAVFAYKGSVTALTIAQGLLNTTMTLNPAGLVIAGLVGVVAATAAVVNSVKNADENYYKMGDTVEEAGRKFDEAKEKGALTDEYIAKWEDLKQRVADNKLPAEELKNAQQGIKDCEQWFIDNYGDYITAEEKKNGIRQDTVDVIKDQAENMTEIARLELEIQAIETGKNIPDLQKNVTVLEETNKALESEKEGILTNKRDLTLLVAEWEKFKETHEDISNVESDKKLQEIINKANDLTGLDFSGAGMAGIETYILELDDSLDSLKDTIDKNQGKIDDGKESIQKYLDNVQKLITCDVDAPLEEKEKAAHDFGVNFADGVVTGLVEQSPKVAEATAKMVDDAVEKAKKKAGIRSPSRVMRDEVGKMLVAGVGVGISENEGLAITAMEGVCVKLEKVSKNAAENAEEMEKKRRARELKNLKNALDLELITEREYYEYLKDYRDKNLRQGSDDWYRYTEEILKYNKRMADRVVESQREMLERVQELQGELAQKLKTDNAPWFEATKTVIRGIGDFGRNAVYYNNKLSDFQSEIEMLTGYRDAILALKELGNIPEGVFDDISHMSVEEGLASARAILTAGEEARSRFVLGYNRRSELAGSISAELNPILNREALEEAGIYSAEAFNSAYFKKDEEEKTEFVRLLEQSFESVPDSYYRLGTSAAESFAEGFTASIPDIMAEIRSSMTEAMNSLVNELASTLESRVKAENSGKSTTFNNTYTFNASKDTTTQQLAAARNSATLERLRGGY